MPKSFFILSKEYLKLAIDELVAIAKMYDVSSKIKIISNLIIIESNTSSTKIARRATFVKTFGQFSEKLPGSHMVEKFTMPKYVKTFTCRTINLTSKYVDSQEQESLAGDIICKFTNAKVKFDNPDIVIYLIFTNEGNFFGFSRYDRVIKRAKKLASHPNELDWRLTRVMLNLIGLGKKDTVCDPFCGTGTTLLEAESMGISGIGIDIDSKMCQIAKTNIKENGHKSQIFNADYHLLSSINWIQGIVTDLPYGQNSKVTDTPKDILKEFLDIIPKNVRFAVMFKKEFGKDLKLKGLKQYEIYRHKSLTRIILVK